MVGTAAKVQQASADMSRLDDVLHYRRDWRFSEEPAPVETFAAGRLSMQGVSFGYNPLEPPLIEDFSLEVAPGQWVALVGDSGSGKSTLGKLITGLYTPRGGEIRIDGHTLADWGRDRLAHIVASVDQDIHLFPGTLRDNVTLWDETVTHRTLLAAIDDAGLGDVVKHLPGQLSTARSRRAAATSMAASASASRSPARWCRSRRCWCSTRRPAASMPRARARS